MQRNLLNRRTFMQTGTALGAGVMSGAFAPEMNFFGSASAFAAESAASETPKFVKAVPVWEEGREEEMNVTLIPSDASLSISFCISTFVPTSIPLVGSSSIR